MLDKRMIEYLPEMMRDMQELNQLFRAEESEMMMLENRIRQIENNLILKTADLQGVERREKIVGIKANENLSLEERKIAVLAKENAQLPYTLRGVRRIISGILGHNKFHDKVEGYNLILSLNVSSPGQKAVLIESLRDIIPANLRLDIKIELEYNSETKGYVSSVVGTRKVMEVST